MKLEDVKKETLVDTINKQRVEILKLKEENIALRYALQDVEKYRTNAYILMSENFRYKRMMEIMDEEKRDLIEQLNKEKKRLDKAERGIRNLQKWMELKGLGGSRAE